MSTNNDPANVGEIKDKIYNRIDDVLDDNGFVKRSSGPNKGLGDFDRKTGFWEGVLSKPPRWLFHLDKEDSEWVAKSPDHDTSDRLGYYNVRVDNVAAGTARLVPVVQQNGKWAVCKEWEWLCIVYFSTPLKRGSSSQTIEGFTPPDFTLDYQGEQITPLSIQVFSLCDPNATCTVVPGDLTYDQATVALRKLFGIGSEGLTENDNSSGSNHSLFDSN